MNKHGSIIESEGTNTAVTTSDIVATTQNSTLDMKTLGKNVKHLKHLMPQGRAAFSAVIKTQRRYSCASFKQSLERGWGPRALEVLQDPPREIGDQTCFRLVTVRHGMGYHNDAFGTASFANRDADLNHVGQDEANLLGEVLRDTTLFQENLLIVVSPFTRALQTLLGIMGGETSWKFPTIVQPLCAEHTLSRSTIQQGDRGSTREELEQKFPPELYPMLDFSTIDRYCRDCGAEAGSWWHHGLSTFERPEDFEVRAENFRKWLGYECALRGVTHVLVVSHGGLLCSAFDNDSYENCEFRVFDLCRNGDFFRCSLPIVEPTVLIIYGVEENFSGKTYKITGMVAGIEFSVERRLSTIRECLHAYVRRALSDSEYLAAFPTSFPGARIKWPNLRPWLQQLAVAIEKKIIDGDHRQHVISFFLDPSGPESKRRSSNSWLALNSQQTSLNQRRTTISPPSSPRNPRTLVISWVTPKPHGVYEIIGCLEKEQLTFMVACRLSEARESLHVPVKSALNPADYRFFFPTSFPGASIHAKNLEPWLQQLSGAINSEIFEEEFRDRLITFFRK
jgi:broad specificity phosphatase PhoE